MNIKNIIENKTEPPKLWWNRLFWGTDEIVYFEGLMKTFTLRDWWKRLFWGWRWAALPPHPHPPAPFLIARLLQLPLGCRRRHAEVRPNSRIPDQRSASASFCRLSLSAFRSFARGKVSTMRKRRWGCRGVGSGAGGWEVRRGGVVVVGAIWVIVRQFCDCLLGNTVHQFYDFWVILFISSMSVCWVILLINSMTVWWVILFVSSMTVCWGNMPNYLCPNLSSKRLAN